MQRHPIPRLSEKNACPIAPKKTLPSTLLKSGFSRNSIPALAPGSDTEQMASTTSRINSMGIIILADFSIPFSTPFMMMKCVANKNTTNQITGRHGLLTKPLKEAMNSEADLPAKLLVAASPINSKVQPATTE